MTEAAMCIQIFTAPPVLQTEAENLTVTLISHSNVCQER